MSQKSDNPKPDSFNPFDPTGLLKQMRDASMDTWSKAMIQVVNTDGYAQTIGQMLDAWLTTSAPVRKMFETTMIQTLATLNLPSRDDITRIAERLTNIELRLDDLDAKVDESVRSGRKTASPKPRPT